MFHYSSTLLYVNVHFFCDTLDQDTTVFCKSLSDAIFVLSFYNDQ